MTRATRDGQEAINVVIVDDHNVVRQGLRMVLEAQQGFEVVGDASSGEDGIRVLDDLFSTPDAPQPTVVVMDLMMEGIGGIEATRRIKQDWPDLGVLVLTMADDRAYLREAFGAGASGYVLKDAVDVELIDAVKAVAEGGRYLHPSLGAELARAEEEAKHGPTTQHGVPLSRREVDVLRCVALGYSNKEIADELYISVRTVETHKTHIMQKTGLRARSDLTRFARDAGIVTQEV
jgi:two-component system response regulator NreC